MNTICPCCGHLHPATPWAPPEPPIGTWVKDKQDAAHVRIKDVDGRVGWASSVGSTYAFGKWEAMWEARGPLTVCGPYGADLPDPTAT
jgi:hypothetical protein